MKNLITFLTTTQSPHFEANFHFADKFKHLYKKIYFINIFSNVSYRNEFTWRKHLTFKVNLSRKIRNGLIKNICLKFRQCTFDDKFKFINIESKYNFKNQKNLIYDILETYSSTEHNSGYLRNTEYDNKIQNSIYDAMSITDNFINTYKIKKNDDFLIFNGRHPLEYSIKEIIKKKKFYNLIFHEANIYQNKVYFLKHNLHELKKYTKHIYNYYQINKNKNLLDKWYRLKKIKFLKKKKNKFITYFTSNNDEYKFTYKKPINQSQIIGKLFKINFGKYKLKIRVHPNTKNKSEESKRYWDRLKQIYPDQIINYNEKVSSYDLCRMSLFTLSIGSSMAAESIILDTPHLLIGNQSWLSKLPGFFKCNENDLTKNILGIKNEKKNKIKKVDKNYAVASQFFLKEIGDKIKLDPLGKYPKMQKI